MAHPFKHFHTITKHRHKVIHFCFKVGVGWQGLRHDLSKYSPTEFWSGAHYYTGTHSPITEERKVKGYSESDAYKAIYQGGFIIKAEIDTILNIGHSIAQLKETMFQLKCH